MINLADIVNQVDLGNLDASTIVDEELPVEPVPSDRIEAIEKIVEEHGGDPQNVIYVSGPLCDQRRLAVATNPEYTDRCRNHPYFKDLLGKSYGGKVFQ